VTSRSAKLIFMFGIPPLGGLPKLSMLYRQGPAVTEAVGTHPGHTVASSNGNYGKTTDDLVRGFVPQSRGRR
jgi:hypothetical protein